MKKQTHQKTGFFLPLLLCFCLYCFHSHFEAFSLTESGKASKTSYILNVPFISQLERYPTGCESVSAVMALNYFDFDIDPDTFIDHYLPIAPAPFYNDGVLQGYDPNDAFLGSPYEISGWGCFAPAITSALNEALTDTHYIANDIYDDSLDKLCHDYIDNDIPVIIWATMGMDPAFISASWEAIDSHRNIVWKVPMHCLVLTGYDESNYYFNDPQQVQNISYPKSITEDAYQAMGSQAVVITEK